MNDTFGNISTKHLNKVSDIFTPPLYNIWKKLITQKCFPNTDTCIQKRGLHC